MPHGSVRKNSTRVHAHIVMLAPGHYTSLDHLLDPSPKATEQRHKERAAQALTGLMPATSPHEGGRPSVDPPGRLADGSQLLTTQKEENHAGDCSAQEEKPKTRSGNPCPHPLEEISQFGDIILCKHCWTMIDLSTSEGVQLAPGESGKGEQSPTLAA